MHVSVVLFTSDLRLHDHPPPRAALDSGDAVVPLFVRDRAVAAAGFDVPNRSAFLADCLADLDASLRERGGRLVVRSGDLVEEVCRAVTEADADEVHMSAEQSPFATLREPPLRAALEAAGRRLFVHDAVTVAVPPGEVTPASSDHFAVFTPYYRRWAQTPLRAIAAAPRRVPVSDHVKGEPLRARGDVGGVSPALPDGGESKGRKRMVSYWRRGPDAAHADYRTRRDRWRSGRTAKADIEAWREGRTGYPVIDAGMRQLRHEGWMHNRARLLTASFLAKTLYID